jgi:RimJ/RimL family protein N-acetyltransferase
LNDLIVSERLVIEPLLGSHAEILFEALSEPSIYRWISALPPPSREFLQQRWTAAESRGPPFWNQGYATEAVRALASHLERQGVVEQRALVTLGNDASARVLTKAGFVRTRVLPDNDTIRGEKYHDVEYVRKVCAAPV